MHSKSESGRTVLEMIVVIALIMLLIIGGLYGVERAYIKVQVKFVTERLITLKNQRMINAAQKQGSNRHTEQGPFGAELTLVNGEGNQDDYFWIIVKKLNAYFCNEMAKADVGAVEVDEQCPEESIFYFSKFSNAHYWIINFYWGFFNFLIFSIKTFGRYVSVDVCDGIDATVDCFLCPSSNT